MNVIFESNVLNLLAVWICLYVALKPSFSQAISAYTDKLQRTRIDLETRFLTSKQTAVQIQKVSKESTDFENFVASRVSKQTNQSGRFLENWPVFELSEISDRSLEVSLEDVSSKLNILL